ncbi:hypothetical protein BDQ12DRAFT_689581 [Crucibulum laeve]|uniref:Uncharacterized protein n=1 Tax=Crucibulum laeve TaxID=68775 RepID=A0A5C3LNQ1_9AGAR|nr:hypothetical protein BDQ12DRAFT_689581 [Crucibulum laeve]
MERKVFLTPIVICFDIRVQNRRSTFPWTPQLFQISSFSSPGIELCGVGQMLNQLYKMKSAIFPILESISLCDRSATADRVDKSPSPLSPFTGPVPTRITNLLGQGLTLRFRYNAAPLAPVGPSSNFYVRVPFSF